MAEILLIFIVVVLIMAAKPLFTAFKNSTSQIKTINEENGDSELAETEANPTVGSAEHSSSSSATSRVLTISNKLVSVRNKIFINDTSGEQKYMAKYEMFAFFSYTYGLYRKQELVATVRKKIISLSQTWVVSCDILGNFLIRNRILSFNRHYTIIGGKFDGATFAGNIWGLNFAVQHENKKIAQANSRLLSLRDRQTIELMSDNPNDELITAIAMSTLHIAHKREQADRDKAAKAKRDKKRKQKKKKRKKRKK